MSLLFPAAALAYCGVVLAGKVVLGETVSRRRWLGTLVITLGRDVGGDCRESGMSSHAWLHGRFGTVVLMGLTDLHRERRAVIYQSRR